MNVNVALYYRKETVFFVILLDMGYKKKLRRLHMLFKDIKAIVFDLDGTLYEDTHHFEYYAKMISKQLDSTKEDEFMEEYYKAASGNHTLKIGRIYDSVKNLVLVHSQKNITEAYTWDGEPIESSRVKELYPEAVEIDMERYMSVGDPWWIPGSLGIHYGLNKNHTYEAFLQTREYMMSPEFVMSPVKDFKETLVSLRDRVKLILLTNSPQPDSEVILDKLGMADVFHKKIFNGKKPSLTLDRFNMIKDEFNLEFSEILSVGDNFVNEILPLIPLGCKTIYMDYHNISEDNWGDMVVNNISELVTILKKIN